MTDDGVVQDRRDAVAPRIVLSVPPREADAMFDDAARRELASLGDVVEVAPDRLADEEIFREEMASTAILISAWGVPRLDAERLRDAPDLRFVMHAASSLHALVTDAFWETGIPISQAGAAMSPAVAELSLGFTLSLLRRMHRTDHLLRSGGSWDDARAVPRAREIRGSRIGVIGASRTGRAYIDMCRALGAEIAVFDPYLPGGDPLTAHTMDLEALLAWCDVLAIHAPKTPETEGMLGGAELARLRDGALVVNTARAELLDADALYAEVSSGRLDAALDVFEVEPLTDRWRSLPNMLVTPHLGGATEESRRRAGRIVVDEISRFLAGEPLQHRLTRDDIVRMG